MSRRRRFKARIEDPLRQWKLSPMDLPSRTRWYDYSRARDMMLEATDTRQRPWHIVRSDDKSGHASTAFLTFLKQVPYEKVKTEEISLAGCL